MSKSLLLKTILVLILVLAVVGGYHAFYFIERLDKEITERFDGKKWQLPTIVYARPLELYPTMNLSPELFEKELQLADYRKENPVTAPGGYWRDASHFTLTTRDFHFPGGVERSTKLQVIFNGNRIDSLRSHETGEELPFIRLDPAKIGSFHPQIHEDRLVLRSPEIPHLLRQGLMAIEDKDFNSHLGVSPMAIARALTANITAGKTVQGGSTLTQQLVKNLFLDPERTLSRKLTEAIMALLLELRYSKDEILTAYVNEIFLGQDGARAIHGFALASQFYFHMALEDISVGQMATLIGMVKGPSSYDPRRHPDNCRNRRDLVLRLLWQDNLLSQSEYKSALSESIYDIDQQRNGLNRFPAYLDLVRMQLLSEYQEEDLQGNGFKILTNLNPQIQWQIEKSLSDTAATLSNSGKNKELQGAVVITGRENGEVLGLAAGTNPVASGFNRAIDANRPIGSLVKPAVFLTALERGYTLASPLSDTAIHIEDGGSGWSPQNYDKKEHGRVPLYLALAKSYNLATVRLGMNIGLENVISTLKELGCTVPLRPYPSLLLGSIDMSPLQVSQLYQTLASGGFHLPLRSIQSVITPDNKLLTRYGLKVEQRFSPPVIQLLTHGLERVVSEGTGSSYPFSSNHSYAGKTGTSDGLRDSWFAGFSSAYLAVVWMGRDDNKPTSLTGASGALRVWGNIMERLDSDAGAPATSLSQDIVWARISTDNHHENSARQYRSTLLPFIVGTEPNQNTATRQSTATGINMKVIEDGARNIFKTLNDLFQ